MCLCLTHNEEDCHDLMYNFVKQIQDTFHLVIKKPEKNEC